MHHDTFPDPSSLPSHQQPLLAKAIGRRLLEVERRFWSLDLDPLAAFVMAGGEPRDFFGLGGPAPTQLRFEGGLVHAFCSEPEWLSVLVSPEPLASDDGEWLGRLVPLSRDEHRSRLRTCLGRRCDDVRIWFVALGERGEPQEAAVSYLFESDVELFYATWIHGASDSDQLHLRGDFTIEHVSRHVSLATTYTA